MHTQSCTKRYCLISTSCTNRITPDTQTTNLLTYMLIPNTWLVIPCFNEEKRLPVDSIALFLKESHKAHLCMVDDGSTDNTHATLLAIQQEYPKNVTVLRHDSNKGKGEAVRTGVIYGIAETTYSYFGYWDADLATPFSQISLFTDESKKCPDWEILMGCRHQRLGTNIKRKLTRHYLGRIFATLVSHLLTLPVYDTQCGAKLFRKDTATELFSKPFLSSWIFDVELLARFIETKGHEYALAHIREVPLEHWKDINGSKLSFAAYIQALRDIISIKRAYDV